MASPTERTTTPESELTKESELTEQSQLTQDSELTKQGFTEKGEVRTTSSLQSGCNSPNFAD